MTFPFESLVAQHKELGLIVAVLLGFGFGFVLERAGFGRSTKLAAQFYLHDMTVFKVMFSAIVTAMLGLVLVSGLGLADLTWSQPTNRELDLHLADADRRLRSGSRFHHLRLLPRYVGRRAASGHIDGWVTFGRASRSARSLYSEIQPSIVAFHNSGELGARFLYDALGVPPQVLAVGVVLMAVGCFIGAEKVEAIFTAQEGRAAGSGKNLERPIPLHGVWPLPPSVS